ncbi:hypothetical protein SAY86_015791 [Trapa natans]|uniref:SKP1 component POZ domain-containing protein n=1 Tax=Trapa natans TaxID=22666 RepID=A0AAN7LBU3_TRANT|nr:hypothetical protein SAY86_015791 [Trapa natans]
MSSTRKITLSSSDGVNFEVDEIVAIKSEMINDIIEHCCIDGCIPLPLVNSKTPSKVIQYCKEHAELSKSIDDDLNAWNQEFLKVYLETIFIKSLKGQ